MLDQVQLYDYCQVAKPLSLYLNVKYDYMSGRKVVYM